MEVEGCIKDFGVRFRIQGFRVLLAGEALEIIVFKDCYRSLSGTCKNNSCPSSRVLQAGRPPWSTYSRRLNTHQHYDYGWSVLI